MKNSVKNTKIDNITLIGMPGSGKIIKRLTICTKNLC